LYGVDHGKKEGEEMGEGLGEGGPDKLAGHELVGDHTCEGWGSWEEAEAEEAEEERGVPGRRKEADQQRS
jgi:hypothetical protein